MRVWTLLLAILFAVAPAAAEEQAPPEDPMGGIKHVKGPKLVTLQEGIEIDLPADAYLVEKAEAIELAKRGGDDAEGVIGMLVHPEKNWFIVIAYAPIGYVTDSDANQLDAKELLESFMKGTIEQNKKRVSLGIPELFIDGWSERPRYEKTPHHLVWGLDAHTKEGKVINFFTNILGRGGYVSINLIDDPAAIEAAKVETAPLRNA